MNKNRILAVFTLIIFISLQLPIFSVLALSDEYTFSAAYWDACFNNSSFRVGKTSLTNTIPASHPDVNLILNGSSFEFINSYLSYKESGSPAVGLINFRMPMPFTAVAGSTLSFQLYVAHDSKVLTPNSSIFLTKSNSSVLTLSRVADYGVSTVSGCEIDSADITDDSEELNYLVYDVSYTFSEDTEIASFSINLLFNKDYSTVTSLYNSASKIYFGLPTEIYNSPTDDIGASIELPDYILEEIQAIGLQLNNIEESIINLSLQLDDIITQLISIKNNTSTGNSNLSQQIENLNLKLQENLNLSQIQQETNNQYTEEIRDTTSIISSSLDYYTTYITVPTKEQKENIEADEEFISDGETQKDEILIGIEQTTDISDSALKGAETEVKDSIGRIELITGNTDFSYVMDTIFDNSVMTTVLGTACSFSLIGYIVFGKR